MRNAYLFKCMALDWNLWRINQFEYGCNLPLVMYTTTSIMMPTLLNINAVNARQCSLARSTNGGFGKLCRLRNDLNDLWRSIYFYVVFSLLCTWTATTTINSLFCNVNVFSFIQKSMHRCFPESDFWFSTVKVHSEII